MMYMEAQLSQLTGMVEKALNKKRLGKKQVNEEPRHSAKYEVLVGLDNGFSAE